MFGFRPGCLALYLAHIKKVASRRRFFQTSHHTAWSTTPMQGKTTEWFTCMGGAARCLMSVVCCGSAVGTVGGPPAQGGVQILGGTPQFQDSRFVCERIVSDDIDSLLSTFRVHDVSYRVLGDSRAVPLIVLCLVTFSHLSRLCGFDFPLLLCLLRVSGSLVSCWVLQLFRVTEVLMASREKVFGLWVLQLFRAKSSHDHWCCFIVV